MSEHDGSFLTRWSRRKALDRSGVARPDAASSPLPAPDLDAAAKLALRDVPAAAGVQAARPQALPDPAGAAPPAPTLADVAELSAQSDYSRFVARGVTPEVRNAALKKLFTDPHFNLMDGLDTYIDDYGKPDPLPADMLRQMVQSHLLGLFSDDEEDASVPATPGTPEAALPTPAPTAAMGPPLADGLAVDAGRPLQAVPPIAEGGADRATPAHT